MASAMPDPRLPSQPQDTPRPVVLSDRIEICVRQTDRQTDRRAHRSVPLPFSA